MGNEVEKDIPVRDAPTEPKASTLEGRAPRSEFLDGMTIVDVDVHVQDPPAAVLPYCEQPWRRALEWVASQPERYLDLPAYSPGLYPWPAFPSHDGRRMTVSSPSEMSSDLRDLGVDIAVIFPDYLLLHAAITEPDYAVAVARAYNRWITSEWLGAEAGLEGAIIAPHHDPQAAAAEIRSYADKPNVVGVFLPTSCVEPLYGHRRYDPVYDAAQETGLPVFLHSVTAVHPVFPFNLHGFNRAFGVHIVAHSFSMIANLVSMMETGVPARFPNLKIAFTEAGIAWVPWIMMRLDKEYAERRREVPFLLERPSEYIKRSFFFATQPIEEPDRMQNLATLIEDFGCEDMIMFASDWPHHDFDHPKKVLQIPVSADTKRKIMGDTALKLLGLTAARA